MIVLILSAPGRRRRKIGVAAKLGGAQRKESPDGGPLLFSYLVMEIRQAASARTRDP